MNIWDTGKEFVTRAATGGVYGSSDLDSLTGGGGSGSSALDLIPGIGDARAQERANQINIEQAELNRKFQERMSSTAYQRAMADMKKAGLNPTLAYMQGGASAPSGSQATVQSASKAGLGEFAMNAAMGIQKNSREASAVESQIGVNESAKALNGANAAKAVAQAEESRVRAKVAGKDLPQAELGSEVSKWLRKGLDAFTKSAKDLKERAFRYHKLDDKAVQQQQNAIKMMRKRQMK